MAHQQLRSFWAKKVHTALNKVQKKFGKTDRGIEIGYTT